MVRHKCRDVPDDLRCPLRRPACSRVGPTGEARPGLAQPGTAQPGLSRLGVAPPAQPEHSLAPHGSTQLPVLWIPNQKRYYLARSSVVDLPRIPFTVVRALRWGAESAPWVPCWRRTFVHRGCALRPPTGICRWAVCLGVLRRRGGRA